MEIQNLKMRVTPEQSRIVQQTLFNNGCQWESGRKEVKCTDKPFLYLEDESIQFDSVCSGAFYNSYNLPELTFQEFFDRYVKWCIRVTEENKDIVYKWKLDKYYSRYEFKVGDYAEYDGLWSYLLIDKHIELTFEQFEKYVIKNKDMEKVIGYKFKKEYESYLKAYCAIAGIIPESDSIEDYKETGYVFQSKSIVYDRIKKAGVLDLWFEPVYESKELYFGKVKFTIHEGYADTEYGKVTKESLREIFNYITSVPTLSGWNLMLKMPNQNNDVIKFGKHEGTLGDLISIYEAM